MSDGSAAIATSSLPTWTPVRATRPNQAAIISLILWVITAESYGFRMKSAPEGKFSSDTLTCPEVTMIFTGGHRPRT